MMPVAAALQHPACYGTQVPGRRHRAGPPRFSRFCSFRSSRKSSSQCRSLPKSSRTALLSTCCLSSSSSSSSSSESNVGFSACLLDMPWAAEDTWSTFSIYFFLLHIPLSIGGLSIVSWMLRQSDLDPLTMVSSAIGLQTAELIGALMLLQHTMKRHRSVVGFFVDELQRRKGWINNTLLAAGSLVMLVLITTAIADTLTLPESSSNCVLKQILSHTSTSRSLCFVLHCAVAPLLEETLYRGFLLTSLASTMKMQHALLLSSALFALSHFSVENFFQLTVVGCVLGATYCRTGNLASSLAVHSVYNAVILLMNLLS